MFEAIKIPINTKSNESEHLGISGDVIVMDAWIAIKYITVILQQPDGTTTIYMNDGGDISSPLPISEVLEKIKVFNYKNS